VPTCAAPNISCEVLDTHAVICRNSCPLCVAPIYLLRPAADAVPNCAHDPQRPPRRLPLPPDPNSFAVPGRATDDQVLLATPSSGISYTTPGVRAAEKPNAIRVDIRLSRPITAEALSSQLKLGGGEPSHEETINGLVLRQPLNHRGRGELAGFLLRVLCGSIGRSRRGPRFPSTVPFRAFTTHPSFRPGWPESAGAAWPQLRAPHPFRTPDVAY